MCQFFSSSFSAICRCFVKSQSSMVGFPFIQINQHSHGSHAKFSEKCIRTEEGPYWVRVLYQDALKIRNGFELNPAIQSPFQRASKQSQLLEASSESLEKATSFHQMPFLPRSISRIHLDHFWSIVLKKVMMCNWFWCPLHPIASHCHRNCPQKTLFVELLFFFKTVTALTTLW